MSSKYPVLPPLKIIKILQKLGFEEILQKTIQPSASRLRNPAHLKIARTTRNPPYSPRPPSHKAAGYISRFPAPAAQGSRQRKAHRRD